MVARMVWLSVAQRTAGFSNKTAGQLKSAAATLNWACFEQDEVSTIRVGGWVTRKIRSEEQIHLLTVMVLSS